MATREVIYHDACELSPGMLELTPRIFKPRFARKVIDFTANAELGVNPAWIAWFETMRHIPHSEEVVMSNGKTRHQARNETVLFISHDFNALLAMNHFVNTERLGSRWDWTYGLMSTDPTRLKLRYTGKILRPSPSYTVFSKIRTLYNRGRTPPQLSVFDCVTALERAPTALGCTLDFASAHRACWACSAVKSSAVFRLRAEDFWHYGAWMRASISLYTSTLLIYSAYDCSVSILYDGFKKTPSTVMMRAINEMTTSPFNSPPADWDTWQNVFNESLQWIIWASTQPSPAPVVKIIDTRLYVTNVLNE